MPKKSCRYNAKHKYDTDEDLLSHEKYCPDKSKRTDLKVCPYNSKHVVLTKQYEKHIKNCKSKLKAIPKKEEDNKNDNDNGNNNDNNNKNEDWELNVEKWIDESVSKNEPTKNEKNKIIIEKLRSNNNQDIFDEEDFIFKECYI